ncbi:hypothetical protein [Rahnella sp. PCH160]|uniref:hypothetical protein n=1 Tax=Rahnella sp. PCH160 TaxID=3447928 RepID=UPI0039FC957D
MYAAPLLLVAGIAYGNFKGGSVPDYVLDAQTAVSNKMSNSYGITKCKAKEQEVNKWDMSCVSENTPEVLIFSVQSSKEAPYDVPTSFYLVAGNDAAKKASGESLLSYLMVNTNAKTDEVHQLVAN